MSDDSDLTNIGLSVEAHTIVKRLKTNGVFADMADAYRTAAALALALRIVPPPLPDRVNVFGVATIDVSGRLASAVEALAPNREVSVYRYVERLADWGIREIERRLEGGTINLEDIRKIASVSP